jgi:hypothetical protein
MGLHFGFIMLKGQYIIVLLSFIVNRFSKTLLLVGFGFLKLMF